jgi:hypothetical protein
MLNRTVHRGHVYFGGINMEHAFILVCGEGVEIRQVIFHGKNASMRGIGAFARRRLKVILQTPLCQRQD